MSLIKVTDLTFYYDGSADYIFNHASFQIDTNWKLGFIGRNGRGKTTFLKLLLGKYEYKGSIAHTVEFDYFPYDVPNKGQTAEEIGSIMVPDFELWKLQKELAALDLSEETLYRPFHTLSNGEQTKMLLAFLFIKENNFLLIDEPTNHLDQEARQLISHYLNVKKKGFILVSHDRWFLDSCVDHILSINKMNIEVQKGNFTVWQENKYRADAFELAENVKLKREIKKLDAAAKRTENWSDKIEKTKIGTLNSGLKPDRGYIGHKAAKMMQRAKNLENRQTIAITEKSKLLKNIDSADKLSLSPMAYYKQTLIRAEDISIFYGSKKAVDRISFTVERGDRIALRGKNGSGKSSILKLILGMELAYEGMMEKGSNLTISYISQDTSGLSGDLRAFAKREDIEESLLKTILRKLDFSRDQFEKNISEYSEGQKKKVLLAKSLCQKAHLYVWDEPLNFIDILSRIQIEELIVTFQPTMVFVEHDTAFTDAIATKVIDLS